MVRKYLAKVFKLRKLIFKILQTYYLYRIIIIVHFLNAKKPVFFIQ